MAPQERSPSPNMGPQEGSPMVPTSRHRNGYYMHPLVWELCDYFEDNRLTVATRLCVVKVYRHYRNMEKLEKVWGGGEGGGEGGE